MSRPWLKDALRKTLYPDSVAVIGASRSPRKIGFQVVYNLIKDGFRGRIYPVNPNAEEIMGLRAYPSIAAIPDQVDVAVIAIPAEKVLRALKESIEKGVSGVVVITSGFGEIGRAEEERELVRMADEAGIALLGPNVVGILNTDHNMNLSFCPSLPYRGRITMVTQSGALAIGLVGWTWANRIGLSKMVSIGNMAQIGFEEMLEYLGEDDDTETILLYMESLKDGRRFVEIAREVSRKKPIVAIKSGRSQRGAKAAMSHTGSLAGDVKLYDVAFRASGVIPAYGLEDGFDKALALHLQPPMRGPNLVVVTNGGGAGVLASDFAEEYGIPLRDMPQDLEREVRRSISPFGSPKNPIDLTGNAYKEDYIEVLDKVLSHPWVDGVVAIYVHAAITDPYEIADGIVSTVRRHPDKPVIMSMIGGREVSIANTWLRDNGIPVYPSPRRAVAAASALYRYGEFLKRVGQ